MVRALYVSTIRLIRPHAPLIRSFPDRIPIHSWRTLPRPSKGLGLSLAFWWFASRNQRYSHRIICIDRLGQRFHIPKSCDASQSRALPAIQPLHQQWDCRSPPKISAYPARGHSHMSFSKLLYIVVFAWLRQLAGQISEDTEDLLPERLGGIRQFHRLIPFLQKLPQERVAPHPPLDRLRIKNTSNKFSSHG